MSAPAEQAPGSSGAAALAVQQDQRRPSTYAGLHQARVRASSASGQRRGSAGRSASNAQHANFLAVEGRPAPLHAKPQQQQMNYQQWQAWEQQQQQMLMMQQQQQQWQASGYPVFGQYATHDGSSPRHAPADANAPLMAQLIQQGTISTHSCLETCSCHASTPLKDRAAPATPTLAGNGPGCAHECGTPYSFPVYGACAAAVSMPHEDRGLLS